MRPLFTLPLPSGLVNTLTNHGFLHYEDIFKENDVLHEQAAGILKEYSFSLMDMKSLCKLPNITSAAQEMKCQQMRESIPTFSETLDELLGGGVHLDSILHVCGSPGSGKTLLGLQLCVAVQIPLCLGGLEGEAVYIDTDSGFSLSRLSEIAEGAYHQCCKAANCNKLLDCIGDLSTISMLEKVHYLAVMDHIQFIASVQILDQLVSKNPKIKLIVVDSLTFPFLNLSNTLDRTRLIYKVLNQLSSLAIKHNLAVVVTNHLTTKITKTGKNLVPSFGESFSHRVPQTLLLGKVNNLFSAVLHKSPYLPEVITHFTISKDGLRDINYK